MHCHVLLQSYDYRRIVIRTYDHRRKVVRSFDYRRNVVRSCNHRNNVIRFHDHSLSFNSEELVTGTTLSEALIRAATNPQHDKLQVQDMKTIYKY